MTDVNYEKFERQGQRAFNLGQTRDSCRYKNPNIVKAWQAGWDRRAEDHAERESEAKVPRWKPHGGNRWATPPRLPTEYHLCGDAPRVIVHRTSYSPGAWFVSCHGWGIDTVKLDSVDPDDAKREAIAKVAEIARVRVAWLEKVLDAAGDLCSQG